VVHRVEAIEQLRELFIDFVKGQRTIYAQFFGSSILTEAPEITDLPAPGPA
jgi:hypothetical protein